MIPKVWHLFSTSSYLPAWVNHEDEARMWFQQQLDQATLNWNGIPQDSGDGRELGQVEELSEMTGQESSEGW